jgi:hypothetical protein
MLSEAAAHRIEIWKTYRLVFYAKNPRKNDAAVDRMVASIQEYGFKIPVLARSSGEVVDGHLRLKAAKKLGISEVPVILCDEFRGTGEGVPADGESLRNWAAWDDELVARSWLI